MGSKNGASSRVEFWGAGGMSEFDAATAVQQAGLVGQSAASAIGARIDALANVYEIGLSAPTLATINSIMVALMVLGLSDAETPNRVRRLRLSGHRIADPIIRERMRIRVAVLFAGMWGLVSTSQLILWRPSSACNDGCDEGIYSSVLATASNITAIGLIGALFIYLTTWRPLPDENGESGFERSD